MPKFKERKRTLNDITQVTLSLGDEGKVQLASFFVSRRARPTLEAAPRLLYSGQPGRDGKKEKLLNKLIEKVSTSSVLFSRVVMAMRRFEIKYRCEMPLNVLSFWVFAFFFVLFFQFSREKRNRVCPKDDFQLQSQSEKNQITIPLAPAAYV